MPRVTRPQRHPRESDVAHMRTGQPHDVPDRAFRDPAGNLIRLQEATR